MQPPLNESNLAFDVADQLVCVDGVEGVNCQLLRPIRHELLEVFGGVEGQVLPFFQLPLYLIEFPCQLASLGIDLEVSDFPADFDELHYIRSIPLDRFNPHVIVHSLLHECTLRKVL